MIFAKKSLGQHFLKSERALNTIVDTGDVNPGDLVLEIGPGQGALTEKLLVAEARVIAVEKDDSLAAQLKEKFGDKVNLIHADILDFDLSRVGENYKVVANIPYNITGAVLQKFLASENQPSQMTLLVQKEVAERIVAKDGKESILSVSVKAYGTPRYIEKVLAGSFVPAPKVDSAIIDIGGISKSFFTKFSEKDFFILIKAGFSSKRKKLSSNLANLYPKERVLNTFQELSIDPNARAEELSLEKWGQLAAALCYN